MFIPFVQLWLTCACQHTVHTAEMCNTAATCRHTQCVHVWRSVLGGRERSCIKYVSSTRSGQSIWRGTSAKTPAVLRFCFWVGHRGMAVAIWQNHESTAVCDSATARSRRALNKHSAGPVPYMQRPAAGQHFKFLVADHSSSHLCLLHSIAFWPAKRHRLLYWKDHSRFLRVCAAAIALLLDSAPAASSNTTLLPAYDHMMFV